MDFGDLGWGIVGFFVGFAIGPAAGFYVGLVTGFIAIKNILKVAKKDEE